MNIKPNLQFSVLCDDVRREDNGKFMLVGIFEAINAKKFPATHPSLFVANRWSKGEGTFTQKIRIVNPKDNSLIFQTDEQVFELPGDGAGGFRYRERLLYLAQNLRLPHHHGVQAGCHAKQVAHCLLIAVFVEMRANLGRVQTEVR